MEQKNKNRQASLDIQARLRLMRKYLGGTWTLNQIVIMQHILVDHIHGRRCIVSQIAKDEAMRQQTVSGAIAELRLNEWVTEEVDQADGRVRLLSPSEKFMKLRAELWKDYIGFI